MNGFVAFCIALLVVLSPAHAADPTPYGRLPAVEEMRISPSGQRYALVGMVSDKRRLVVVQDKKPLFVTDIGDIKVRNIIWAGEDHVLILVTKTENLQTDFGSTYELATVLRVNLKDKSMTRIFEGVPSVAPRVFGMYGTATANGKSYGYFGGITLETATGNRSAYVMRSTDIDLYRVDLDSGKANIEIKGLRDLSSRWLMAPDGTVAGTSFYESKTGTWRVHSGQGRNTALMQKVTPLSDIHLVGRGRTPGALLVDDNAGDVGKTVEVHPDGSTEELFQKMSISGYLFDPATGLLIGAKLSRPPYAMFFDPAMEAHWSSLAKTFPGVRVSLQSVSNNLDRMIIESEGGGDSGTFWLAEPATGKTTPLGQAYPGIRPSQVGSTQMVHYKAEDGLAIAAVLTLPPLPVGTAPKNLPLVVMPHGGPIGIHDEIGFDWWAQAFAGNGYAVLQPNYRGSSGYGVEFRDAGYGEWGHKMLSDIKDGIDAMAAKGVIDPKRVCVVGASYGGYAAMAGITLQQGIYRCAVAVAGVSDVRRLFKESSDNALMVRYRRAVTGTDKRGEASIDEISPINFVKRADAPILLIHGKDDTVVPIAQSGAMADALESAGKPVEMIRLEGEDHWLSRESTRMTMVKASLDFVQKYNPVN